MIHRDTDGQSSSEETSLFVRRSVADVFIHPICSVLFEWCRINEVSQFICTPAVKSLSALEYSDLHFDRLVQWKRSVEHLFTLTVCPTVHADSITDDLQWDHTNDRHHFDLSSNRIFLRASNRHALIYDHVSWKLILYDPSSSSQSFDWLVNDYGEPCDLTCSPHLRRFLIITYRGVFLWS